MVATTTTTTMMMTKALALALAVAATVAAEAVLFLRQHVMVCFIAQCLLRALRSAAQHGAEQLRAPSSQTLGCSDAIYHGRSVREAAAPVGRAALHVVAAVGSFGGRLLGRKH